MKTEIDEDHMIEISDDDDGKETSEENVTVQSGDTLKDMKWEGEANDTNEGEDPNEIIEPEKITRSRRVLRRPKRYEDYEPFYKKGNVILMYIFVGYLLDSGIFSIRPPANPGVFW